jgi:exodeoxyribonuclease V alpha subunit
MFFLEQEDKEEIPDLVGRLCEAWHREGKDYAVLAPQKNGVVGVEAINKHLQERLNPPSPDKPELKVGWVTLRQGDKVLQTKNNYQLGVFNGFTGTVLAVDPVENVVVVEIDGETFTYEEPDHIKQLALGYCMTVHKSQGSQFANGVLICHSSHYYMWSRSILYTGISRFREELWVVGDKKALKRGVSNVVAGDRNTLIKLRLQGEE